MRPTNYLFINKSEQSGSLSHSEKPERIKIHSHVQLGKLESRKNRDDKENAEVDTKVKAANPAKHKPQVLRWKVASATKSRRKRSPATPAHGDHDKSRSTSISSTSSSSGLAKPSVPPTPQKGELMVDPFLASRVQVDSEVHRLMQYFLREAHPNTWHIQSRLSRKYRTGVQRTAEAILQTCFDSDVNLYTMLASMASRLRYLEHYDLQPDSTPYVSKAIVAVQQHIAGVSTEAYDERLIFNMFYLGTAEFYRWNVEAALVHLKAMKVLVDRMGGLRALHSSLVEMLAIGDGYVAAETLQKPLFDPADFDIIDEEVTRRLSSKKVDALLDGTSSVAIGLLSEDARKMVPPSLRWIVIDMAVCLSVLEDHTEGTSEDKELTEALYWLHVRNLAIRHRLLLLDTADARIHALRTALLMWNLVIFTKSGKQRSAGVMAKKLKEQLVFMDMDAWRECQVILAWVLIIGGISSKRGEDVHAWFVNRLALVPHLLGNGRRDLNRNTAVILEVSEQFLHYHITQSMMLLRLAEDATNQQKSTKQNTAS